MSPAVCPECAAPCEDHGMTFCGICHKHEGQCDFGDCEEPARLMVVWRRASGEVSERRPACPEHGREGSPMTEPIEGYSVTVEAP